MLWLRSSKADAGELRSAMSANTWDLANSVEAARPVSEKLEQELKETADEQTTLQREVKSLEDQRQAAAWNCCWPTTS